MKNSRELENRRIKVTFTGEPFGKSYGALKDFCPKKTAKRVRLQFEIWEGAVSLPMRSRGGVPGKFGN